jgi:hypothetical protein
LLAGEKALKGLGRLRLFAGVEEELQIRRWDHDLGVWEIERSRLGADTVDVIAMEMAD